MVAVTTWLTFMAELGIVTALIVGTVVSIVTFEFCKAFALPVAGRVKTTAVLPPVFTMLVPPVMVKELVAEYEAKKKASRSIFGVVSDAVKNTVGGGVTGPA